MLQPSTSESLSAENAILLQRVAQMVQNEPQRFACAGRFLDDRYSKAAYRARLENELRRDIGDLPSDHPMRVSCQEKFNRTSLSSPRARCEAAIDDLLHRGKCDDFRRDMNPAQAARIILLTAIGDCPEIQPTESACDFQRLPWQWNAKDDEHLYQGRHMIRARIHSGDWLELVRIAEGRLSSAVAKELEHLRQRFKDAAAKYAPLHLTIVTDYNGVDALPYWDMILTAPTWTSFFMLGPLFRITPSPLFGQGQIHTTSNPADARAAYDALSTLGNDATRLLKQVGIIEGSEVSALLQCGILWLNTLHDIATEQGANSPLRIERTRLLRIDKKKGKMPTGFETQIADKPIPKGRELLFPHGEVRRIVPNLFEASVMALTIVIEEHAPIHLGLDGHVEIQNHPKALWADSLFVSISDIKRQWPDKNHDAIDAALRRFRYNNDNSWRENENRQCNTPKFTYKWGAIKELVLER